MSRPGPWTVSRQLQPTNNAGAAKKALQNADLSAVADMTDLLGPFKNPIDDLGNVENREFLSLVNGYAGENTRLRDEISAAQELPGLWQGMALPTVETTNIGDLEVVVVEFPTTMPDRRATLTAVRRVHHEKHSYSEGFEEYGLGFFLDMKLLFSPKGPAYAKAALDAVASSITLHRKATALHAALRAPDRHELYNRQYGTFGDDVRMQGIDFQNNFFGVFNREQNPVQTVGDFVDRTYAVKNSTWEFAVGPPGLLRQIMVGPESKRSFMLSGEKPFTGTTRSIRTNLGKQYFEEEPAVVASMQHTRYDLMTRSFQLGYYNAVTNEYLEDISCAASSHGDESRFSAFMSVVKRNMTYEALNFATQNVDWKKRYIGDLVRDCICWDQATGLLREHVYDDLADEWQARFAEARMMPDTDAHGREMISPFLYRDRSDRTGKGRCKTTVFGEQELHYTNMSLMKSIANRAYYAVEHRVGADVCENVRKMKKLLNIAYTGYTISGNDSPLVVFADASARANAPANNTNSVAKDQYGVQNAMPALNAVANMPAHMMPPGWSTYKHALKMAEFDATAGAGAGVGWYQNETFRKNCKICADGVAGVRAIFREAQAIFGGNVGGTDAVDLQKNNLILRADMCPVNLRTNDETDAECAFYANAIGGWSSSIGISRRADLAQGAAGEPGPANAAAANDNAQNAQLQAGQRAAIAEQFDNTDAGNVERFVAALYVNQANVAPDVFNDLATGFTQFKRAYEVMAADGGRMPFMQYREGGANNANVSDWFNRLLAAQFGAGSTPAARRKGVAIFLAVDTAVAEGNFQFSQEDAQAANIGEPVGDNARRRRGRGANRNVDGVAPDVYNVRQAGLAAPGAGTQAYIDTLLFVAPKTFAGRTNAQKAAIYNSPLRPSDPSSGGAFAVIAPRNPDSAADDNATSNMEKFAGAHAVHPFKGHALSHAPTSHESVGGARGGNSFYASRHLANPHARRIPQSRFDEPQRPGQGEQPYAHAAFADEGRPYGVPGNGLHNPEVIQMANKSDALVARYKEADRMMDPIRRAMAILYLFSPVCRDTVANFIENGVPSPLSFIVFTPFIEQEMKALMFMSRDMGNTFVGYKTQIAGVWSTVMGVHVDTTYHIAAMITFPEKLLIIDFALYGRYVRGNDHSAIVSFGSDARMPNKGYLSVNNMSTRRGSDIIVPCGGSLRTDALREAICILGRDSRNSPYISSVTEGADGESTDNMCVAQYQSAMETRLITGLQQFNDDRLGITPSDANYERRKEADAHFFGTVCYKRGLRTYDNAQCKYVKTQVGHGPYGDLTDGIGKVLHSRQVGMVVAAPAVMTVNVNA